MGIGRVIVTADVYDEYVTLAKHRSDHADLLNLKAHSRCDHVFVGTKFKVCLSGGVRMLKFWQIYVAEEECNREGVIISPQPAPPYGLGASWFPGDNPLGRPSGGPHEGNAWGCSPPVFWLLSTSPDF